MAFTKYLSYRRIKTSYEKLDNKKRLLVLIISMASILLLWYLILFMPLQKSSGRVNNNAKANLDSQIKMVQSTMVKLIQAQQSPDSNDGAAHTIFYNNVNNLYLENKIQPNIDSVIRILLNNRYGLELNGVQNHPMSIPTDLKSNNSPFKPYVIELSFSGSFLQMAAYLKQFEKPAFPLYFKNLKFSVTKYPTGRLTFDILTIIANKPSTNTEKNND